MTSFLKINSILLFFLALGLNNICASEELIVYVKGQEAPAFDCWLAEKPSVLFDGNRLILKSTTLETTLDITEVARIEFISNETEILTDIEDIEESRPSTLLFRYTDNQTVIVDGVAENASIRQYSLDGKPAPIDATRTNQRIILRLGHLPKGFYIICIDNQTYKILKK